MSKTIDLTCLSRFLANCKNIFAKKEDLKNITSDVSALEGESRPIIIEGSINNSNNEFEPSTEFTQSEWDSVAASYESGRNIILDINFYEVRCLSTIISWFSDHDCMTALAGTTNVIWRRPLN